MNERGLLDSVIDVGYEAIDFENRMMAGIVQRCLPYVRGKAVLTLGYAGDDWPRRLHGLGCDVTIVEGAKRHYDMACSDFAGYPIEIHYETFERFDPDRKFDTVVAGSVIEFFKDPNVLLDACKQFLRPGGRLIVTTPNALSIHRRIGAILGMESTPRSLNAAALAAAANHMFDPHSLRATILSAEIRVVVMFGCHLKFLSTAQMRDWNDELLDSLVTLSQEFPMEFCKELVAVCDV